MSKSKRAKKARGSARQQRRRPTFERRAAIHDAMRACADARQYNVGQQLASESLVGTCPICVSGRADTRVDYSVPGMAQPWRLVVCRACVSASPTFQEQLVARGYHWSHWTTPRLAKKDKAARRLQRTARQRRMGFVIGGRRPVGQ